MSARAFAVSLVVLAACGGGSGPHDRKDPDLHSDDVELALGTGSYRFEPLEDGQQVELIQGAQGGFHIWLSLRVRGFDAPRLPVQVTMQPADESRPAREQPPVALSFESPDDDGYREHIGYTGVVHAPSCLVGELLRVQVALETEDGSTLRAERDVRVLGGTYPPDPCDE